jgi:hypothetical protein
VFLHSKVAEYLEKEALDNFRIQERSLISQELSFISPRLEDTSDQGLEVTSYQGLKDTSYQVLKDTSYPGLEDTTSAQWCRIATHWK